MRTSGLGLSKSSHLLIRVWMNRLDPDYTERMESRASLTQEKQREIQLYSSIDYQPFFRHYVQDVLRLNQDLTHNLNEKGIELPLTMVETAHSELSRFLQKRQTKPPFGKPVQIRHQKERKEQENR